MVSGMHEWERLPEADNGRHRLTCNPTGKTVDIARGKRFQYCPFCGEDL